MKFMKAIAVHEAFHHVEFHIQYGIQYGLLNFLYYNKDIRGIQGYGDLEAAPIQKQELEESPTLTIHKVVSRIYA